MLCSLPAPTGTLTGTWPVASSQWSPKSNMSNSEKPAPVPPLTTPIGPAAAGVPVIDEEVRLTWSAEMPKVPAELRATNRQVPPEVVSPEIE